MRTIESPAAWRRYRRLLCGSLLNAPRRVAMRQLPLICHADDEQLELHAKERLLLTTCAAAKAARSQASQSHCRHSSAASSVGALCPLSCS